MREAVTGGLQPQPCHHNVIWDSPYPNFSKFGHHLLRYNSVRVHPYAHPQHMKVLKHFLYIEYGCGMQSVVAYSLNHDTTMSFGPRLTTIFRNLPPPTQVYQCSKGASICPSTAYEGAQSLSIHPIWMWDAVSGGLQPQPCHHNFIWDSPYPSFQKFGHHLHRYNSVRVHPYAHPQHMKVLKHFLYIGEYGCGMQSVVAYSLNHDTTTSFRLHLTPSFQNFALTCTGI